MPEPIVALTTTQLIAVIASVCGTLCGVASILFKKFVKIVDDRATDCKEENARLNSRIDGIVDRCVGTMTSLAEICANATDELRILRHGREREETDRKARLEKKP